MQNSKLTLSILPEKFGICVFDENTSIPDWIGEERSGLTAITRTRDELSVVCPQDKIPGGVMCEKNWRAFKLETVLDISAVGIVASLSNPLADKGISIFYISTYKTNYLLVEEKNLEKSKAILKKTCEIKE